MNPKIKIEKTANELLNRLLEISVVLDMLSLSGKTSLFSREDLKHLQESLWQTAQEYRMGKEKCEKLIEEWEEDRKMQIKELGASFQNERKRVDMEYSQLKILPGIKRISRKKQEERQELLKKERDEMKAVIQEDFELKKNQAKKSIQKHEQLVQKYIHEAESALYELDQVYAFLLDPKKQKSEKTYAFLSKQKTTKQPLNNFG